MLKKITPLMLAVLTTLALAPLQEAAAWQRVCMKLPLWQTWFAAHFHVIVGFDTSDGRLPGAEGYYLRNQLPKELGGDPEKYAWGSPRKSPSFRVNQSRCVSIEHVADGEPFFVYVQAAVGKAVVCKTHHTNPNPWYHQQNRPYQELWYKAWGTSGHPRCEFTHEK